MSHERRVCARVCDLVIKISTRLVCVGVCAVRTVCVSDQCHQINLRRRPGVVGARHVITNMSNAETLDGRLCGWN